MARGDKLKNLHGLTRREQLFVDYYTGACLGDSTASAIKAGYARKSAAQYGFRLMTDPKIVAAVHREAKPHLEKSGIDKDKIIARLARRFEDPDVSNEDMVKLGGLLAKMIPGALVNTKSDDKPKGPTLEEFLRAQKAQAQTKETDHGKQEPQRHQDDRAPDGAGRDQDGGRKHLDA